jgi:hypothetical protein
MLQETFKTKQTPKVGVLDTEAAKAKLETLKESVQVSTRKVKLKLVIGCGCGRSYTDIEREVDLDSRLKDGDVVSERLDGDTEIKKSKSWI